MALAGFLCYLCLTPGGGGGGKERTLELKKESNSESKNAEKEKEEGECRRKIENAGLEGSRDR